MLPLSYGRSHASAALDMKKRAYLCLGSNLAGRRQYLERALEEIRAEGVEVTRVSSLYESEPVDVTNQPWFLNCVAEVESDLMPLQLLRRMQRVEQRLGRRRGVRRGPRTIDIDILLFGNHVVHTPVLEIPHPRMTERRFVLEPMRELAPQLRHPVSRRTMTELLSEVRDRSRVERTAGPDDARL